MSFMPSRDNHQLSAANYNREGASYMDRQAFREATFYFLAAVVCDPECWPAFFNLGNCWAKLGDYEAAAWAYEQAARSCTEYTPLLVNLGIAYCQNGEVEKALPYLEQAWNTNPEHAVCAAALGYVCYKLDELGLAWHWYAKAYRLKPGKEEYRESMQYIGSLIHSTGL